MTSYEKAKERIESKLALLESAKADIDFADALCLEFETLRPDVSASFDAHGIKGVLIAVHDVPNFEHVTPLLAAIVRRGYRAQGFEDYPEIQRRRWKYGRMNGDDAQINVVAFLSNSGAKCEFKEVGKKEVPIYELVCN